MASAPSGTQAGGGGGTGPGAWKGPSHWLSTADANKWPRVLTRRRMTPQASLPLLGPKADQQRDPQERAQRCGRQAKR